MILTFFARWPGVNFELKQTNDGVILMVKVVPGSSSSRIAGLLAQTLRVNIAAAAEKGKANKQLIAFLAKLLHLPKSSVTVVSGEHNRVKQVHIAKMTAHELLKRLEPYGNL
jgi:uncharacterized protein (TIGR00251 family)